MDVRHDEEAPELLHSFHDFPVVPLEHCRQRRTPADPAKRRIQCSRSKHRKYLGEAAGSTKDYLLHPGIHVFLNITATQGVSAKHSRSKAFGLMRTIQFVKVCGFLVFLTISDILYDEQDAWPRRMSSTAKTVMLVLPLLPILRDFRARWSAKRVFAILGLSASC